VNSIEEVQAAISRVFKLTNSFICAFVAFHDAMFIRKVSFSLVELQLHPVELIAKLVGTVGL
jgi:hypothetical protein